MKNSSQKIEYSQLLDTWTDEFILDLKLLDKIVSLSSILEIYLPLIEWQGKTPKFPLTSEKPCLI